MPESAAPQRAEPARATRAPAVAAPGQQGPVDLATSYGATAAMLVQLQRTVGNRAVVALLAQRRAAATLVPMQRDSAAAPPESDELEDEAAPALQSDEARSDGVGPGAGEPRTLGASAPVQRAGGSAGGVKDRIEFFEGGGQKEVRQGGPKNNPNGASFNDAMSFWQKIAGKPKTLGDTPAGQQAKAVAAAPAEKEPEASGDQKAGQQVAASAPKATPRQTTSDLDEIYKQATKDMGAFEADVNGLASSTGGKASVAPLKGQKRAMEKIETDYHGDASFLVDVLRATITYKRPEQLEAGLGAISKALTVVRLKDRFTKVDPSGYRDMLLNVAMPSGHVAEIQLNLEALAAAKAAGGHKFYEVVRELVAKAEKEKRALTADELATIEDMNRQSRAHYEAALARALQEPVEDGGGAA